MPRRAARQDTAQSLADCPTEQLLGRVASWHATPGAGAGAALTVATAAALTAMAARLAGRRIPDAALVVQRADALRRYVLGLMELDGEAVEAALALPEAQRTRAMAAASEVPLAVAEAAAEIAEMAVRLVRDGNPKLADDARVGALLADAGVRASLSLLQANLRAGADTQNWRARGERLRQRTRQTLAALEQNSIPA